MKAEIEKIKDSVAIKIGFQNWKHYGQNATITDKAIDKVADEYARIQIEKDRENSKLLLKQHLQTHVAGYTPCCIEVFKNRPITLD